MGRARHRLCRNAIARAAPAARHPRHRVSGAGVEGTEQDSRRRDDYLFGAGGQDWHPTVGSRSGGRLRGESSCGGGPLPPRGAQERLAGRLSLGNRTEA